MMFLAYFRGNNQNIITPSDGRAVSIVQHCRLLEMGVTRDVIMGPG